MKWVLYRYFAVKVYTIWVHGLRCIQFRAVVYSVRDSNADNGS